MEILELLRPRLEELLAGKERLILAIDGSCTAGKTTLAAKIAGEYDCNVFHMDDFFLQPHQRTPQRYEEAGGNVDYERFREEVLLPLTEGVPFSYRPFSCRTFTLSDPVAVEPKKLNIVEGTYSLHPYFGACYGLKILLTVTPEEQRSRILQRPAHLHQAFFDRWIPMEQHYLRQLNIPDRCDFIF